MHIFKPNVIVVHDVIYNLIKTMLYKLHASKNIKIVSIF